MANTYTQLNVHAVFSVSGRENLILKNWETELFKYLAGILSGTDNYSMSVGGYRDHVHLFFELNPRNSVSDVLQNVKSKSSKWINERRFVPGKFTWQKGYGAFTYSRTQRNRVIQYIMEQEKHHQRQTFREEYLEMLIRNEVDYNDAYLFEFYE